METYLEVAHSSLLYILVILGLIFMIGLCLFFYIKSYRRAIALGISKETLKKIQKNTLSVTVVPSLAVVVGLISLSAAIGIPWAWFRLSVVGSVSYELIAAQLATSSLGFSEMTAAAQSDASTFGAIMIVMSTGIIAGVFINALFGKQIITGVNKMGQSKSGFGQIVNGCFMLALMAVLIPFQLFQGIITTLVFITSIALAMLFGILIKKTGWGWLNDFVMAFVLILGMASAVIWTNVLG